MIHGPTSIIGGRAGADEEALELLRQELRSEIIDRIIAGKDIHFSEAEEEHD